MESYLDGLVGKHRTRNEALEGELQHWLAMAGGPVTTAEVRLMLKTRSYNVSDHRIGALMSGVFKYAKQATKETLKNGRRISVTRWHPPA